MNCLPKRFILTLFVFEMGPEAHSDMFTHKLYTYITPLSSSGPFICICLPIIQLSWSEGIESFTCYVCLFVFPNNFPWINQHLIDSNDINALRSIFKNGRTNYCTLFTFHWTIYSFDFIVFSWCVCVCVLISIWMNLSWNAANKCQFSKWILILEIFSSSGFFLHFFYLA